MKRKLVLLLACLGLLLSLAIPGMAETESIIDNAELLSREEEKVLEEKARALRQEYSMDVVIVTVDTLDGDSPQDYADDFFDDHGYGYGDDRSGVLLLLAMEERDWYISTSGDAIYALTNYGIQQSMEPALTALSQGEYARGFDAWLGTLQTYFDAYQQGTPIDGYADYSGDYYHGDQESVVHYERRHSPSILLSVVIGLTVAGLSVWGMCAAMNTRHQQWDAGEYLDGCHLRTQKDIYLYSNTTKTPRATESSGSSGGGSSIHHSSGGGSHGGGGGKF